MDLMKRFQKGGDKTVTLSDPRPTTEELTTELPVTVQEEDGSTRTVYVRVDRRTRYPN